MTVESEVANLTTAVDNLTSAVNVSKATLDASKNNAAASASAASSSASTASGHATSAAASAAAAAATASGISGFDLDAIATNKAVTAVDVFVYDTSKDSDGGAWRKRTQHTSWYNETLNTATRGGRREFPAVAVIVAESNKVTIYDGDDPTLPMWMVFNKISSGKGTSYMGGAVTSTVSSISMQNGNLCVGSTGSWADLRVIYFLSDSAAVYRTDSYIGTSNIANRNTAIGVGDDSLKNLVNDTVNDVAMTVLPDAPIDPATGLPIPTIAVATAGGVSVITDSGDVYDITGYSASVAQVSFTSNNRIATNGGFQERLFTCDIPTADVTLTTAPNKKSYEYYGGLPRLSGWRPLNSIATVGLDIAAGATQTSGAGNLALNILRENPSNFDAGEIAFITSTYNTGWMNGDIKGAFLSSTDTASLVASGELVTNGTFDTDTSGWTFQGTATDTSTAGFLSGTTGPTSNLLAHQVITTSIGKTYRLDITTGPASTAVYVSPTTAGGLTLGSTGFATSGNKTLTFVATSTTTYLSIMSVGVNSNASLDSISVKLADADRSVNNKGLIVNGTITRSAVATGAELVAYSGFSASNYLEQPYNSALDFGTGDFCVMGWVTYSGSGNNYVIDRQDGSSSSTDRLNFFVTASTMGNRCDGTLVTAATTFTTGVRYFVAVARTSGVAYFYVNGKLVGSAAQAGDVTDVSASYPLTVAANGQTKLESPTNAALVRISATAPTAEQIKKIYEDEKVLFQDNAACTLYGSSDAVTALAHDSDTNLLHVGTSAGRSVFQGLRRVSNTTTAVGTAISASNSLVVEE